MTLPADLAHLRNRGARQGVISVHRGLRQLQRKPMDVVAGGAMSVLGLVAWIAATPYVAAFWRVVIEGGNDLLRMGGTAGSGAPMVPTFRGALLPRLVVETPAPTARALIVAAVLCVAAIAATTKLPPRLLAAAYWVRAVAIVVLSTVAVFAFAPGRRLPDVADASLGAGAVVIGMVPILLGLTLYLFDPSPVKGAILMLLCMGHLVILQPLQYLLQVALIASTSQILSAACFLMLGPALDVMVVVAFYGWAMGRDLKPRARHPAGIS